MEKSPKDTLSKTLLPLILLLMLVILLTVIVSNLKPESGPDFAAELNPIALTPPTSLNSGYTFGQQKIFPTGQEQIIREAIKKWRLGLMNEAESDFRTILVFDPENLIALSYLGTISYTKGDYKTAELLFRKKTEIFPGNPIAFRNYALTLFRLGKIPEAISAMNRAAALNPDDMEILLLLARLSAYSGDKKTAVVCLKRAMEKGVKQEKIMEEPLFQCLQEELFSDGAVQ